MQIEGRTLGGTDIRIVRQRVNTQLGESFRILDVSEQCVLPTGIVIPTTVEGPDPICLIVVRQ
jgi:hypothetical protein